MPLLLLLLLLLPLLLTADVEVPVCEDLLAGHVGVARLAAQRPAQVPHRRRELQNAQRLVTVRGHRGRLMTSF